MAKPAVLTYRGKWRLFPSVVDARHHARTHGMVGAEIRVVGGKSICCRIGPPVDVFEVARMCPTGRPWVATVAHAFDDRVAVA